MIVVYAPRSVTNDAAQFSGGAFAALVDLSTGEVRDLGIGYSIAYYNPGCGAGDTAAITRFEPGDAVTRIASVDMTSGDVLQRVDVDGSATSAVSTSTGEVLAITSDGVQGFSETGDIRSVVTDDRRLYGLTVDDDQRLGYLALDEERTAAAYILDREGAAPQLVATGPVEEISLISAQTGGFYIAGDGLDHHPNAPGVEPLHAAEPGATVSTHGNLIVDHVIPAGLGATPGAPASDGGATVSVHLTHSDTTVESSLTGMQNAQLSGSVVSGQAAIESGAGDGTEVTSQDVNSQATVGDNVNPVEDERYCAIPRNDPNNQAYQPKPRQVEWAVNRAVEGELSELRPANWRNLGMASYRPQTIFPPVPLAGGGEIPSQVVLGVLMQESNLWQASRYTGPGNTGNPLIGNFYGNRGNSSIWDIEFPDADCGYGIGQITDGMRLPGFERTDDDGNPIETALPYAQQRAIALDYTANIAMAVRMLAEKWNETRSAGLVINDGDPSKIENWFFATWAYNSGFYPDKGDGSPWGVGWFNNPVNPEYAVSRKPFMSSQQDAARPQDWPYPEKVIGWAAFGTSLPETQYSDPDDRRYNYHYITSYRTAFWGTQGWRYDAPPPYDLFCDPVVNECDPQSQPQPCQRSDYHCWWHGPATWKLECDRTCGEGFERFPSSYATEASSMASSLPEITLRSSNLANCSAPPVPMVVVDDTKHPNARNPGECAHRTTAGSFEFTFDYADGNGSYPAKVDLHQQGGGYNGHFYFSHMQARPESDFYKGPEGYISGTWTHPDDMTGRWVRVWVHLPDYAAWTQQAPYTIDLGDGTQETRHLPQRRYENTWVSLGVFEMRGIPSVELSNLLTSDVAEDIRGDDAERPRSADNFENVAWDAVGFEELPGKPADIVVALGDSYASGEGAGDYAPWSDNNGSNKLAQNACHQSNNSWIHKTTIPGSGATIGDRLNNYDTSLDFQFLACSAAQTEHLLPYHTVGPGETPPINAEGETGEHGQYATVSQLDAGYLDENTTLVTISISGNDMRFSSIVKACVLAMVTDPVSGLCFDKVLEGDAEPALEASMNRLENEIPNSLVAVLEAVHERAPNADIALFGYPTLFEAGGLCIGVHPLNNTWLVGINDMLNDVIADAAATMHADTPSGVDVFFVDPRPNLQGMAMCDNPNAINGLIPTLTPGEGDGFFGAGVSNQSVHPNTLGTALYAEALNAALN